MLPSLGSIISAPQQHPSLLVSGSIDMIKLLLTPSPPEVAQQIHAAATPLILQLALQSDDAEVLQAATGYLRWVLEIVCVSFCDFLASLCFATASCWVVTHWQPTNALGVHVTTAMPLACM